ncbi:Lsm1p, partial [Ascoidea rubescens DSM 1968]
ENLYLESYPFTTAAALVGSVDKKIFVLLRDGRNLFGVLRTFDQYANLVLQDTIERIYLLEKKLYGETFQGNFLIRGENVVMFGELNIDKEDVHLEDFKKIEFKEAEKTLNEIHQKTIKTEKENSKIFLKNGLTSDFTKSDLY